MIKTGNYISSKNLSNLTNGYSKGSKNAKIVILNYSDIGCPFCREFHNKGVIDQILKNNTNVKYMYKHFPLDFHKNAQKGAEATECVGEQLGSDGFYSFLHKVYNDGDNSIENLTKIAKDLGVKSDKFKKCLDSNKYQEETKNQMKEGVLVFGVVGIPTNFVLNTENGKRIQVLGRGSKDFEKAVESVSK